MYMFFKLARLEEGQFVILGILQDTIEEELEEGKEEFPLELAKDLVDVAMSLYVDKLAMKQLLEMKGGYTEEEMERARLLMKEIGLKNLDEAIS